MTHTHHAGMGRCAQCEAPTSRTLPDLLDEIKRLTAQVERVRELHDDGYWECANPQHTNPNVGCPECREICTSCGYDCPCPTIRALDADA